MKLNLDNTADDAQIQIVPMIDVIFCILTFFILAALQLTRQQGINIDLPKASTGAVQMRQMLVVSIDASGQTFIDKNPIDKAQLFTLLKEYRSQNPDGLLVLNASQNAFYNDVIQVLDVLRSVGGDKVALATIPAPTVAPGTNPLGNPQNGNPTLTPPTGVPGLPAVPGVTDPRLPSTNNPLAPNAPLPPSNYPNVLPQGGQPTDPLNPNPSGTNPAGPTGINPTDATGINPSNGPGTPTPGSPDGAPTGIVPTTP